MGRLEDRIPEPGSGPKAYAIFVGRMFLHPAVVAYLALALSLNYWLPLATYLLLKTCLWGWGVAGLWALIVALAASFVGGLFLILKQSFKLRPSVIAAVKAKKAGDAEAYSQHLETWREKRSAARFSPLWAVLLPIHLVMPTILALVFATGLPTLVKDHGRYRYATRDEEIGTTLRWMERRGLTSYLRDRESPK